MIEMEIRLPQKKLLVTGASGFLGWNICRVARKEYVVVGISNTKPPALEDIHKENCDITRYDDLKSLFFRVRPDAVIHAAAIAAPTTCQEHPAESGKINVDASISIAGLCNGSGIPCAFISTDLVFDGTAAPYDEQQPVSPISVYGEQKVMAETGMQARHENLRICRMPLMYGDAISPAQSFIHPFIKAMREGKELALFFDEYRTPASATNAAQGILPALNHAPGTLHLGGRESISRYDFGIKLAKALNMPDAKLKAVRQKDFVALAPRPLNVSLDSSKAYAIGYDPGSIEEELGKLECVKVSQNHRFE
jgi:dTDP-4-dehydrorhamnose reductase